MIQFCELRERFILNIYILKKSKSDFFHRNVDEIWRIPRLLGHSYEQLCDVLPHIAPYFSVRNILDAYDYDVIQYIYLHVKEHLLTHLFMVSYIIEGYYHLLYHIDDAGYYLDYIIFMTIDDRLHKVLDDLEYTINIDDDGVMFITKNDQTDKLNALEQYAVDITSDDSDDSYY